MICRTVLKTEQYERLQLLIEERETLNPKETSREKTGEHIDEKQSRKRYQRQ